MTKDREKLCFACPASYPAGYSSCPRCQLPLVFPSIGGVWVVEGVLGRGGMGAVFAAHHISEPGRRAAVKVLVPIPGEPMSDRRDRIGRFHREALALRRLTHENIVQLYDFARERDGSLYLAMERLEGPTLSSLVKREGPLPIHRAVALIMPVLSAVASAHKVGVIHRDLKPDNIVLASTGTGAGRLQTIKVLDFGVARLAGDTFTRTGQALGTPVYMPPEQANGTDIDERADVYGTGAVLYELLTSRPPFIAPDAPNANLAVLAMVVTTEPRPLRELRPEISPALESVVLRAMRRKREERFGSIGEFVAAIELALAAPERPLWVPPEPHAAGPPPPRSPVVLPSLGMDSLPPRGAPGSASMGPLPGPLSGRLAHSGAAPMAPAVSSVSVPAFPTYNTAQMTAPGARRGGAVGIKLAVAALYLLMVGTVTVTLVVDRVSRPHSLPVAVAEVPRVLEPAGERPRSAAVGKFGALPPDGAPPSCPEGMVYHPAGCFSMGSSDADAEEDERPAHEVCLNQGFCLDRTEVTHGAYGACVQRGRCRPAGKEFQQLRPEDFVRAELPAVQVTWQDAHDYCASVDKYLPTEAQWEYAARGREGRRYPWGDEEPSCDMAVVGAYALRCLPTDAWCRGASQCLGKNPSHPLPPGSRPRDRTPAGVMDLGGNVAEWVADWYDAGYYGRAPKADPRGPEQGAMRVYRGGNWGLMGRFVRASYRNRMDPGGRGDIGVGFRCAASAGPSAR